MLTAVVLLSGRHIIKLSPSTEPPRQSSKHCLTSLGRPTGQTCRPCTPQPGGITCRGCLGKHPPSSGTVCPQHCTYDQTDCTYVLFCHSMTKGPLKSYLPFNQHSCVGHSCLMPWIRRLPQLLQLHCALGARAVTAAHCTHLLCCICCATSMKDTVNWARLARASVSDLWHRTSVSLDVIRHASRKV